MPFPNSTSEALNAALSRVVTGDASLLAANGTTVSTTAIYRINLSTGEMLVGGVYSNQGALTDQIILGAGNWAKSWKKDGTAAAVLTADGKTYIFKLVAMLVGGAIQLHAVFGDEANDAAEVAPTDQEVNAAIRTALTGEDYLYGLVLNQVKVQRAGGVITLTVSNPASDAAIKGRRLAGSVNP